MLFVGIVVVVVLSLVVIKTIPNFFQKKSSFKGKQHFEGHSFSIVEIIILNGKNKNLANSLMYFFSEKESLKSDVSERKHVLMAYQKDR